MNREDIKITYSRGRGKSGKMHVFIRPVVECFNRSRRVSGFTNAELNEQIRKVIAKWFTPLKCYTVDGKFICSSNEKNALKEYHRVCDISKVGVKFTVTEV